MDFQVFYQGREGSDYKICGNGFAKPSHVLFSHIKNCNEKTNECSGTILMYPEGNTRGMH